MPSSERIYHTLRQEILNLTLKPGQQLREDDLARRFGVSRSPVRAAVSRLSTEKLLRVEPRKGTFVTEIEMDYVRQLIFLRTSVELRMLPLLCQKRPTDLWNKMEENLERQRLLLAGSFEPTQFYRLDNKFHEMYFNTMELDAVWKLLQQFYVHYTRFRVLDMQRSGLFRQFYEEHCQILELMRKGQQEELCSLMVQHLESPFERITGHSSKTSGLDSAEFVENISCNHAEN
ncbi:MAG: GntR family transcriptional regulator [Candidatus Merdivicinus sp.]|jgi:DNA-binding GntR family transcriptional regulator